MIALCLYKRASAHKLISICWRRTVEVSQRTRQDRGPTTIGANTESSYIHHKREPDHEMRSIARPPCCAFRGNLSFVKHTALPLASLVYRSAHAVENAGQYTCPVFWRTTKERSKLPRGRQSSTGHCWCDALHQAAQTQCRTLQVC